jgi:uncharacterized phage protein (TIGR01671 family)
MRQIKFRTWDIPNKQMLYAFSNKFISDAFLAKEVRGDDLILMQFTGLLDKNGKEIYESDLVGYLGQVGEVYWDEQGAWMVKMSNGKFGLWEITARPDRYDASNEKPNKEFLKWEVIGNTYENP